MTKLISKHRNAIMGLAILWILVYHSDLVLPVELAAIKRYGYGGVDIFLFLSGFGLYRSLDRNSDRLEFYKRRLHRVLPAFFPILLIWFALKLPQVQLAQLPQTILGNLTGLSFWARLSPSFNWYMLALFSFYLFAPFLADILKKHRRRGALFTLLLIVLINICLIGRYQMIAISRYIIFFLGMIVGKWHIEGREVSKELEIFTYIAGVLSCLILSNLRAALPNNIMWDYALYWYPFIFIAPAMIFALCRVLPLCEKVLVGRKISKALAICGAASLEIYLLHIIVFEEYLSLPSNWLWVAACAVAVLLGYGYHIAIDKAMAFWGGRKKLEKLTSKEPTPLPSANEGKRTYIEFMRIAAAFLVIVNHTNNRVYLERTPSATWYVSLTYFFVCKIAVPVFFLIMGALLLEKQDTLKKWLTRIVRIAVITIIFSIVYYLYAHRTTPDTMSVMDFLKTIFSRNITNAFWYLYTYLGILCMLPLLQKMAATFSRNHLRLLLFVSLVIAGGFPLIKIFFSVSPSSHFLVSLISPYIGMVFAGYYIERYLKIGLKEFIFASALFTILIILQVSGTRYLYQLNPESYRALDNRTYITITGSAICFYIIVKYLFSVIRIPNWLGTVIRYVGGLTFGIYLLSDLMISLTDASVYTALLPHVHVLIAMLIWEVVIFASGGVITAVLKSIPIVKKWL